MARMYDVRHDPRFDLEAVQQWVRDHGHAPEDILGDVVINADTSVLLRRIERGPDGRRLWSGDEVVTTTVTVIPTRPFPITPEAL